MADLSHMGCMSPSEVKDLRRLSRTVRYEPSKDDVWRLLDTVAARDEEIVELMRLADGANSVVSRLQDQLDKASDI